MDTGGTLLEYYKNVATRDYAGPPYPKSILWSLKHSFEFAGEGSGRDGKP